MTLRACRLLLPCVALLAGRLESQQPDRHVIYLHARIMEDSGRRAVSPEFGPYRYDAILDSLRGAGFVVLADQRPPNANSEQWAERVAGQVDSLIAHDVRPSAITVMGFSKGGWIAILASARIRDRDVNYVFMAACGPWTNDNDSLHVTGRILSLYETSDRLGGSCQAMLARRGAGPPPVELPLSLGLGHGTFFVPRQDWLRPAVAWVRGQVP